MLFARRFRVLLLYLVVRCDIFEQKPSWTNFFFVQTLQDKGAEGHVSLGHAQPDGSLREARSWPFTFSKAPLERGNTRDSILVLAGLCQALEQKL